MDVVKIIVFDHVLVIDASGHHIQALFFVEPVHPGVQVVYIAGLISESAVDDVEEQSDAVFPGDLMHFFDCIEQLPVIDLKYTAY